MEVNSPVVSGPFYRESFWNERVDSGTPLLVAGDDREVWAYIVDFTKSLWLS